MKEIVTTLKGLVWLYLFLGLAPTIAWVCNAHFVAIWMLTGPVAAAIILLAYTIGAEIENA